MGLRQAQLGHDSLVKEAEPIGQGRLEEFAELHIGVEEASLEAFRHRSFLEGNDLLPAILLNEPDDALIGIQAVKQQAKMRSREKPVKLCGRPLEAHLATTLHVHQEDQDSGP